MSIIRENQIKQIREETNRLKKIIIDRQNASIKDYIENIKPVEIVDSKIVSENKGKVSRFIKHINELYTRLSLIENNHKEFIGTFSNTKGNEYRKYIELLNIVEPYTMWDDLMDEYTNISTNNSTREQLKINLQKITPYVNEIVRFLTLSIKHLCIISLLSKGEFSDDKAMEEIYDDYTAENFSRDEINNEISQLLKISDPLSLIKEHIESLAFYMVIKYQIEKNNLNKIGKNEIAYEITQIINELTMKFNNLKLEKSLIKLFKGIIIPELAPYFKSGFNVFDARFKELEAMEAGEEKEIAPPLTMEELRNKRINRLLGIEGKEEESSEEESSEEEAMTPPVVRGRPLTMEEARTQRINRILGIERERERALEEEGKPKKGKGKPKNKPVKKAEKHSKAPMDFDDKRNDPYYNSDESF